MAHCFGPHEGGYTSDFVFGTDINGDLAITFTQTGNVRIVKLNQFDGKKYDYNGILGQILQEYPATASIYVTDAAKKALNKQAQKNQQY